MRRKMKSRTFLSFCRDRRDEEEGEADVVRLLSPKEPVNCQNLQIVRVRDV